VGEQSDDVRLCLESRREPDRRRPAYTVAMADVGEMISVTVTAANDAGAGAADSNALGPIEPPPPPVHVDPEPEILGLPQVGGTLVATNGGWMGTGLTFARQWLRDDVPILNAILQTYAPTDDDLDAMLSVDVTAWTAEGGSASATSDPVGPVIQAVVGGPIFDPSDLGPARPA
jgi:hypothetical protein